MNDEINMINKLRVQVKEQYEKYDEQADEPAISALEFVLDLLDDAEEDAVLRYDIALDKIKGAS